MLALLSLVGGVALAYVLYRGVESIVKQIFNKEKFK